MSSSKVKMGNCQNCGLRTDDPNHQCVTNMTDNGVGNGFNDRTDNGMDGLVRPCINRREQKQARKLANAQAVCNLTQTNGVGGMNHSAKYYKIKAKQAKLDCKLAKANRKCRC